jgi:serine/threonine protein kinase
MPRRLECHVDEQKASELLSLLQAVGGIRGYTPTKYLGHGASAAVYEATHANAPPCALKIFEPEYVDAERLDRQLALKGHGSPHLIEIFDGGETTLGDNTYGFIIMSLADGETISEIVKRSERRNDPRIRKYLQQLCIANEVLLAAKMCHRDIKPANINITSSDDLVLLDIGIIKPFEDNSALTDHSERRFIGSRRYASPEFQHRTEEQTPAGWEALTVYQVGAVLYELIHGARLFSQVPDHPPADLVSAIDNVTPQIHRGDVGPDLLDVCRRALNKDWKARPKLAELKRVAQATYRPVTRSAADVLAQRKARWDAEVLPARKKAEMARAAYTEAVARASAIITKALGSCGLPHASPPFTGSPRGLVEAWDGMHRLELEA